MLKNMIGFLTKLEQLNQTKIEELSEQLFDFNQLEKHIGKLEQWIAGKDNWIAVEESQPLDRQKVDVWSSSSNNRICDVIFVGNNTYAKYETGMLPVYYHDVTHWREIPLAPTETSKSNG